MKKFYLYILIILTLVGCAGKSTKPKAESLSAQKPVAIEAPKISSEIPKTEEEMIKEEEVIKGVIAAKTDFKGVLETTYVKLFIEGLDDNANKFDLYIGDKQEQQAFNWDAKTVQPGYFFIELPAGKYKISSLTIPVASTQAIEKMDITLEVLPEEVTYLGTLEVVGTKEKIKLGVMPVIRPGFEYSAAILNEHEEASAIFKQRFPNSKKDISIQLMQLHKSTNVEDYSEPQ